jgi:broad specificity phosphatase PhoE
VRKVYFITHPDVVIDPAVPIPRWPLSQRGRARMEKLLSQPWIENIGAIYCSTEQKAIDGAAILARHLSLDYSTLKGLGEIDRSSTGYLPADEFRATVEQCFAHADESICGWESARQAQQRIADSVEAIVQTEKGGEDIAVVSHGGVGALYLCHLKGSPIGEERQPGTNGGCFYCFEACSKRLVHGWRPIDSI